MINISLYNWDDARTTDEISLEQSLRSVTQQYIKTDAIAQQVRSADRLLQVIGQKCPDFRNANDNLQTVYICIENRIRYLPQILCCACRSMHPISQNGDNDLIAGNPRNFEIYEPLEFLAAVTQHIPDKCEHQIRYYGWYSNLLSASPSKMSYIFKKCCKNAEFKIG